MDESRHDFLKRRSEEMRLQMTKAEKKLRRLLNSQWRAQEPLLGRYIADFFHPIYRIVVEADGGYHNDQLQAMKDAERDAVMARDGICVLRFTNTQILKQTAWVSSCIDRQVDAACRVKGLERSKRVPAKVRMAVDRRRALKQKRLNGGKRTFHVIPERDIDEL